MALNAGRWPDRTLSVLTLLFYSVPGFWIGLMLIVLFSIRLGWLPSGGAETIASGLTGFPLALDRLRHMILPGLTLALFFIAVYARLTRAADHGGRAAGLRAHRARQGTDPASRSARATSCATRCCR